MSYSVGTDFPSQLPVATDVTKDIASADTSMTDVGKPTPLYERMRESWEMIEALLGGTKTMRDAGTKYLPQEVEEAIAAYENRLARSVLFNGFNRTVRVLASKPFLRPITYGGMSETLKGYCENIDLQGNRLDLFLWYAMLNALSYGHTFLLVDHPKRMEGSSSKEDDQRLDVRPFWRNVSPIDVIGWRYKNVAGHPFLTQVRIKETLQRDKGKYGAEVFEQIKVLEPGKWATFEQDKNGKWAQKDQGQFKDSKGNLLKFVPLIPIYFNQVGYMTSKPPLLDLAFLNVHHWQTYSDYTNIVHVAQVPILFGKGFDEDVVVKVGVSSMIPGGPDADLKFVEHTGKAIASGESSIESIENRMRTAGAELLSKSEGRVTATQRVLESDDNTSDLQRMALNMADGANRAMRITAAWIGVPEEEAGEISLFTDFSILTNRTEDSKNLLAIRVAGELSRRTYLEETRRRGTLSDGLDIDEEIEAIENEENQGPRGMDNMPDDFGGDEDEGKLNRSNDFEDEE